MNTEVDTAVREILEHGYWLCKGVLTHEECATYRELLERDHRRYAAKHAPSGETGHGLNDKSGEKVVYNLHNKDVRYFDLFDHPRILPVIARLLQAGSYGEAEPFNLLNISARSPAEGCGKQQLHLDGNLPGQWKYPLIVNVVWMIDEFIASNGATRVVPQSHRLESYAENGRMYEDEIVVEAGPGSVLLFNAALWHGGNENRSGADRWAILLGYGRWFLKPSFDFLSNTPREIFDALPDSRKALLGFDCVPPSDEFTRTTRRSVSFVAPHAYHLPK